MPVINRFLLVAVLALVLAFQSSAKLAFAYGTAVTGTILVTTRPLLLHRAPPLATALCC